MFKRESLTGFKVIEILIANATIKFPVFNATSRSLTSQLLRSATGGKLDSDASGRVSITGIDNLSLRIMEGERVALLGHNGAGKSTLLRTLSGVYWPESGTASVQGVVGSLIDLSLGINSEATGSENVYIRGALLGLSRSRIKEIYDEIVEFSELGQFINMPVRTYSSGMLLRLAFAISTVIRPDILLMDEWLSVGDESFQQKAEARLTELVNESKILVIASHSRGLIEKTCTRAIWLDHGQIKMDGPADQVTTAYFG
jgi:lipopolysaccharide transport system ATP-binding protein